MDSIQALVLSIVFSFAQCFSYAGAPLNHSPFAIQLFWSAQDISRLLSLSSLLIQPVQSLSLNHFNRVSLEWALTHMSFPRILPDSSTFPGVILKFISKFDVTMNSHQSDVFLQDRTNSFHRWLNLFAFDSYGVSK